MYKQADVAKKNSGRLWAIGQKGFEICIFRFDVLNYMDQDPDCYTKFNPLNLSNLTEPQLDLLNVKYKYSNEDGFALIALVKWRLDNRYHITYINRMFEYIKNLEP